VPDYEADAVISRIIGRLIDLEDQLVLITKGDAMSGSIPGVAFRLRDRFHRNIP
jgi:hypothetical protein